MKKVNIIIVVLLITLTNAFAQVELKGVELGSKMTEDLIETTLIGEEYTLAPSTLNDGRAYMIIAIPTNGEYIRRVFGTEITKLKTALEGKYSIKFRFTEKEYSDNEGSYSASKDGVDYLILVSDYNRYMDEPYKMVLYITNQKLDEVNDKEEQAKANSDL